jgi:hypothetical protein
MLCFEFYFEIVNKWFTYCVSLKNLGAGTGVGNKRSWFETSTSNTPLKAFIDQTPLINLLLDFAHGTHT